MTTSLVSPALPAGVPPLNPALPLGVALLTAALDVLSAQSAADIPPAQALLETSVLLVQQDRLRAVTLSRVADVDSRGLHDLDGSPSTGAWVAEQHTSMTRSQVALARKLEAVPQIAARIAAGGLSVEGGVLLARALGSLRPYLDRPDGRIDGQPGDEALYGVIVDGVCGLVGEAAGGLRDDDPRLVALHAQLVELVSSPLPQETRLEAAFLLLAARIEPGQLKGALGQLVDALLPVQLQERSDRAHLNRGLDFVRDEQGWDLRGRLDDECGELLFTVVNAAMATDPANPDDTAAAAAMRDEGEDPAYGCGGRIRNASQRRHDGLKLALQRLLSSGALGTRGKAPVQIGVTVSASALHGLPGALPARATSGSRLPAALARSWLCDSAITRFVLSLGHRVLETSHTERTLKPHERRIKHLETGGVCQAAGCGRGEATGHVLIPHHPIAYSVVPETSLGDTVLFCELSHDDVHVRGKVVKLKDGRRLGPNGWLTDGA